MGEMEYILPWDNLECREKFLYFLLLSTFTKSWIKQMLKISAVYLDIQKRFIPKENMKCTMSLNQSYALNRVNYLFWILLARGNIWCNTSILVCNFNMRWRHIPVFSKDMHFYRNYYLSLQRRNQNYNQKRSNSI